MKKFLTIALLTYMSLTQSSFIDLNKPQEIYKNKEKHNLENFLESKIPKHKFTIQPDPQFKQNYQKFVEKYVTKIHWSEEDAISSLNMNEPGTAIITKITNKTRIFIDGFGKGKNDGIIDVYSEQNSVLEADSLEYNYRNTFGKGLSNTENYFLEDLVTLQKNLLENLKTSVPNSENISNIDVFEIKEGIYLILTEKLSAVLTPQEMNIEHNPYVSTYISYNSDFIPEIYEELYQKTKTVSMRNK